jgi:molybdopterin-guanine dinucleotide biosynthesis protein A
MPSITAIVLAGGRSSRMGHDKAQLPLGPETLLQHTCQVALACTPRVTVVTPWPERYRPTLPPEVWVIPEQPLPGETDLFHGPLVALTQAIEAIQASPSQPEPVDWVLALACDLPNLSPEPLRQWMAALDTLDPDVLAYLPHRQGRWEPLCGFYHRRCLSAFKRYVAKGGRSFQTWCSQHPITLAPLEDDNLLVNLNTPQDFKRWQGEQ